MAYKRILTIQDISCVGQCSLTVALPILSASGHETAILPSAVLSTHTGGFTGFTFRDLSADMPAINAHWQKEGLQFEAIYTGYLGSVSQIDYVLEIMNTSLTEKGLRIVDPAMADNGKLYSLFDMTYVEAMKKLCATADYLLPNVTEACFLTGIEYRETYDEAYINQLMTALHDLGAKTVVLTGVSFHPEQTGVMISEQGVLSYYPHRRLSQSCHGTGDVYASAFTGALMKGLDAYTAAKIAADFVLICMENTRGDANHTYGVKFEPMLGTLMDMIRIARKMAARD
ncbi:MAG: pyridoxamine kinase [Ruminococcaceae bacterium]|nr:pyridoxamine kinase [Oscillospiraceae bacterium]